MWTLMLICLTAFLVLAFYLIGATISLPVYKKLNIVGGEYLCFGMLLSVPIITFISAWSSYVGFSQISAGKIILFLVFITAIIFILNFKKLSSYVLNKKLLGLLVAFVLFSMVAMLSIFLYHSFNPYNDTYHYVSMADYLQNHSYFQNLGNITYQPTLDIMTSAQLENFRMGAMFFLSLIASIFRVSKSVYIYPAIATFAGILNVAAIYFYLGRVIKINNFSKCFCLLLIVMLYSPLYFAINNGFFSQLFGTAFLVSSIAFLELQLKSEEKNLWRYWGVLYGLSSAAVVSFYSEISPTIFLALFLYFVLHWILKLKTFKELLKYAFFNLVVFSLFANIELYRAYHAVLIQLSTVHDMIGWNIGLHFFQFLGLAFGVQPILNSVRGGLPTLMYFILLTGMFLLLILGAVRSIREKLFAWLIPVIIYLIMAIYLSMIPNPFIKGAIGQTWDLFKLTNWVFPFLIIGIAIGINYLNKFKKSILTAASVLLLIWTVPIQFQFAAINSAPARGFTNSNHPFAAYRQYTMLADYLYKKTSPAPIEFLGFNSPPKIALLTYFLYPLPVYGTFPNDSYISIDPKAPAKYASEPHLIIQDQQAGNLQNILPAGVQYAFSNKTGTAQSSN